MLFWRRVEERAKSSLPPKYGLHVQRRKKITNIKKSLGLKRGGRGKNGRAANGTRGGEIA